MSNPNLTALKTIARREVMRILRIWGQTLVPPAITMTLYYARARALVYNVMYLLQVKLARKK